MYRVVRRTGDIFGDEPHVCEFVCDTSDDVATLPTSIAEGTGGKSKYDNQKCSAGSTAIIATNSGSNSYILNNSDDWIAQSSGSSGSSTGNDSLQLDENGLFTGDFIFPEGVTNLPYNYFYRTGVEYTGAITSITFPTTLTSLGESAIRYITTLKTVIFKGNNLKTIGNYCFMANPNLKELILPDGVESIGNASIGYINIERLHLPASCSSIHANAFASDRKLTNVTIGEGFNCDLNISWGTFTNDVINAIISNYANNSGKTLTIGSSNIEKLTDAEKEAASSKGLTLA